MPQSASKGLRIGYVVVAILTALTMFISAYGKLSLNPGAVHVINEVAGVPMSLFPVLAICEIAGGIGLLAGIYRPKLGLAGAAGLVLYFVGAIIAHVRVGDWAGISAPITPLVFACVALTLSILRTRRT